MPPELKALNHRRTYSNWVLKTFAGNINFIRRQEPRLPKIYFLGQEGLMQKLGRSPQNLFLIWSGGRGVCGAVQLGWNPNATGQILWLASSSAEKRAIESLFLRHPLVKVIPYPLHYSRLGLVGNRVGTPPWAKKRSRFYAKHTLNPSVLTFFFCGRITPSKGLHHLVSLAEKQQIKIQLVLAGFDEKVSRAPGEYLEMKKILQNSVFCQTLYLGRTSAQRTYELMTYFDCNLALSTDGSEDYGLFARQSLCLGTPTLITLWGGQCDIKKYASPLLASFCSVQFDKKGLPIPQLDAISIAQLHGKIRKLNVSTRQREARLYRRSHENSVQRAIRDTMTVFQKVAKLPQQNLTWDFTDLSREILLNAGREQVLNANLCFPRIPQFEIMTGEKAEMASRS